MLWTRGKAHAQDLRERVFAASDSGLPVGRIAETLFVSISYVSKVLTRHRRSGERTARPQRCHVPRKLSDYLPAIRARVEARPDETIAELQAWLLETHHVSASATLVWETLELLDLTLKKRPCTPLSRTVPTSPRHEPSGAKSNPA
jgi:putative transposase